jgi:hypothetical protein
MTLSTAKMLGSILVLMGALSGCKGNQTADTTAAPGSAAEAAPSAATSETTIVAEEGDDEAMVVPESAKAIWLAVDEQSAELKSTIQIGDLKEVHHHAFTIRDLVAALPAHSPELPPEEQTKLQGEVKFVATLADRLDQTGDAGDQAGTLSNYDKLVAVLNGITRHK